MELGTGRPWLMPKACTIIVRRLPHFVAFLENKVPAPTSFP